MPIANIKILDKKTMSDFFLSSQTITRDGIAP